MQLVLLHALPFNGAMWNQMQLLPGMTLAPTLYSLGESIESWATQVRALVTEDTYVVVGNSVGGSCALEVTRQDPDRVSAIVLIGAKAGVRPEPQLRDEAIRTLIDGGMEEAWPKYWACLFGAGVDPAIVDAARRLATSLSVDDVVRGIRAFHNRPDLTDFARAWPKPLVVIHGARDHAPSRREAIETAASPLGELHVIEGAGHYVPLEQPSRVHALLRGVLAQVGGVRVARN